jgi:hypothetical protein
MSPCRASYAKRTWATECRPTLRVAGFHCPQGGVARLSLRAEVVVTPHKLVHGGVVQVVFQAAVVITSAPGRGGRVQYAGLFRPQLECG